MMAASIHLLTGDSEAAVPEAIAEGFAPADEMPVDAASPPTSAMSGMDRKLAAEAYKKVIDGRELTSREQTALKRFEKEKEERLRWQYYAAIPQKHWRAMSGRQTKVINEQALRYDLPFGGGTTSMKAGMGIAVVIWKS